MCARIFHFHRGARLLSALAVPRSKWPSSPMVLGIAVVGLAVSVSMSGNRGAIVGCLIVAAGAGISVLFGRISVRIIAPIFAGTLIGAGIYLAFKYIFP